MGIDSRDKDLELNIDDVNNLGKNIDKTSYTLFQNLEEGKESLQDFTEKFEDIYAISVKPFEIENLKDKPIIYKILKKYEHTAENHPLSIMFFKYKVLTPQQKQAAIEYIKKTYGELAQLDESEYGYIVGYFGGTLGRTMQNYINEIKKIYPVKILK